MAKMSSILPNDFILSDRYRIIKQIGRGGFGRTYLAEDNHRYREKCVLKEFAPSIEDDTNLQKAEELFEREAGILYQLKHDRIPDFKALLNTRIDRKQTLFLVQEYIVGDTYFDLLQDRGKFDESEVKELIIELLPVLEYIHSENLIHRDISPDNLICRQTDNKPVLIDFGCVKLAANAVSISQGYCVTLIGKKGYAPEEQTRSGKAFPNSDLYALAATAVTLLTGKSCEQLYDSHQGKWHWEREVKVSSHFTKVLNKMLAYKPGDRYKSASEVAEALNNHNNSFVSVCISRIKTLIVAPRNSNVGYHSSEIEPPSTSQTNSQINSQVNTNLTRIKTQVANASKIVSRQVTKIPYVRHIRPWQWGLILLTATTVPGFVTFVSTQKILFPSHNRSEASIEGEEKNRQENINQRIKALNINSGSFFQEVNREFYRQHPELKNITLNSSQEHQQYRFSWYKIAEDMLTRIERARR